MQVRAFERYIENSKLCFCDMKIMSRRNDGDLVYLPLTDVSIKKTKKEKVF